MPFPADITIEDKLPIVRSTVTSGTADGNKYAFPWVIFAPDELRVFVEGVERAAGTGDTDYSIIAASGLDLPANGINEQGGGQVQFVTSLTVGDVLVLVRDMPVARATDFVSAAPLRARVINEELDKLVSMIAEREMADLRSLRLPLTTDWHGNNSATPAVSAELPAPVAGKYLAWNATGTAIINADASTGGSAGSDAAINPWKVNAPTSTTASASATVTYTIQKINGGVDDGASSANDGIVALLRVHDSAGSALPSSSATFADAGSSTVLDGAGTATAIVKQESNGSIRINISGTASTAYYVSVEAAHGSKRLLTDTTGADGVTLGA
jgi:hypothetical protein